uniref:RING-type E3 ubiquitin transferase n=1 Tax=Leersia perrieri TaxID=77586 RepID=A0A0D9XT58_9ORYZ
MDGGVASGSGGSRRNGLIIRTPLATASTAADAEISSVAATADKVFVAVAADVEHGRSTLQWTLQELASKYDAKVIVVVAHVHCPAQMIPALGAKLHYTKMNPQQVSDYWKRERVKAEEKLDKYLLICRKLKVSCEKLIIEKDDIAKGLEDLIALHGVTKLVMAAAADKHYSREANTNVPAIPPSPSHTIASPFSSTNSISSLVRSVIMHTSESEASNSSGSTPRHYLARSTTEVETPRHHPSQSSGLTAPPQLFEHLVRNVDDWPTAIGSTNSWDEYRRSQYSWHDSSRNGGTVMISGSAIQQPMYEPDDDHFSSPPELENSDDDADIHGRLEELKKKVHEESTKRQNAERNLISALQKVRELENMYQQEIRQRKIVEETLEKQIQETEETKRQCNTIYDMLHDVEEQKLMVECWITEMKAVANEHENELEKMKCLLQVLQEEKEKLQQERDAAASEAEELRRKEEQRINSIPVEEVNIEFSFFELEQATRGFNEELKIGVGGFGSVYKGRIRNTTVAIKLLHPHSLQGQSEFDQEVRTKIICEMCSALIFLHSCKPHPIIHGNLTATNILLDANLVSKLGDFGICHLMTRFNTATRLTTPKGTLAYMDPEFLTTGELTPHSDVYSLGIIILRLLTGRPPQKIAEVVEDAIDNGSWPFVQASQLAHLGLQCAEMSRRRRPDLVGNVWKVVEPLMKAASLTAGRAPSFTILPDDTPSPSYFLCPIFQEEMSDPHMAADGFTYEAEAIRGWLDSGHDTSPMTNLKLQHRELIPNRALRSAILEWQQQRGAPTTASTS